MKAGHVKFFVCLSVAMSPWAYGTSPDSVPVFAYDTPPGQIIVDNRMGSKNAEIAIHSIDSPSHSTVYGTLYLRAWRDS